MFETQEVITSITPRCVGVACTGLTATGNPMVLRATGPLHVPYTLRIPCKHLSYAPEPVTLVQVTSFNLDYLTFSLSPVSFYFSHARNMNP